MATQSSQKDNELSKPNTMNGKPRNSQKPSTQISSTGTYLTKFYYITFHVKST